MTLANYAPVITLANATPRLASTLRSTHPGVSARLAVERYADVTRITMSSFVGRRFGYDVSAYIVRGMMIDSGFPGARRALEQALGSFDVHGAVITHWHEDHAGNVGLLAERGIPVALEPETESTLRACPRIQLYRRLTWGQPPALTAPIIPFEPEGLQFVPTPGHTTDHQAIWDPESRTLFSGDLWLGVRARVLHETEDPYLIIESLRRALALEPARMFDAHRGLVDRPADAISLKIDWLSETLGEIERRITEGWSDRAIVRDVLGGEEATGYFSRGDYARRNLVRAVRLRDSGEG